MTATIEFMPELLDPFILTKGAVSRLVGLEGGEVTVIALDTPLDSITSLSALKERIAMLAYSVTGMGMSEPFLMPALRMKDHPKVLIHAERLWLSSRYMFFHAPFPAVSATETKRPRTPIELTTREQDALRVFKRALNYSKEKQASLVGATDSLRAIRHIAQIAEAELQAEVTDREIIKNCMDYLSMLPLISPLSEFELREMQMVYVRLGGVL